MDMWSTGDFYDGETILCDTAVVDTFQYTFVKIYRMYNRKWVLT